MRCNSHPSVMQTQPPTFSHSTVSDPLLRAPSHPPMQRVAPKPLHTSSTSIAVDDIPHSVKGAPAHLRQVIRKRQNSESAKRSRKRRKEAAVRFYQRFDQQCQRIAALEKRVAELAERINECESTDGEATSDRHENDVCSPEPPAPEQSPTYAQRCSLDDDPLPLELVSKYVKKENRTCASDRESEQEMASRDDSQMSCQRSMDDELEKLLDTCIDVDDLLWNGNM